MAHWERHADAPPPRVTLWPHNLGWLDKRDVGKLRAAQARGRRRAQIERRIRRSEAGR